MLEPPAGTVPWPSEELLGAAESGLGRLLVVPEMPPEFASLQLTLVDRFVELGLGSYRDGVDRLTNFRRRSGLWAPADEPAWASVLRAVESAAGHNDRVEVVMDASARLPAATPEHVAHQWPTVGAFSIQVVGTVARTHFYATDDDGLSPLHASNLGARKNELESVLTAVRSDYPELDTVAGGSWLYSTSSYRSLFPPAHLETAVVRRGRDRFPGMSHWGQFLDHRWELRPDLADEFRRRVETWTGDDPCSLFPIDTLEVSSPIANFDGDH